MATNTHVTWRENDELEEDSCDVSTGSSAEEEEEPDELKTLCDDFRCLKPYQFEPEIEISETEESDYSDSDNDSYGSDFQENSRVGKTTWCLCEQCVIESRDIDCLCCQEVAAISEDKFEGL